ncbi:hypothetical protein HKX48_008276, partial [Thoreauomyces humboldtii]
MSWRPVTPVEDAELNHVWKTFKTGRDALWAKVHFEYPDTTISQRTVLSFLKGKPSYVTHVQPPKRTSIAPIAVTQLGYGQCDTLSMTQNDQRYHAIFTLVDAFSRYGWARPLRGKSEQEVTKAAESCIHEAKAMGKEFTVWGCDLGGEFQEVFKAMLAKHNIRLFHSPAHQPQANSIVER